jgi:hypothetical protein
VVDVWVTYVYMLEMNGWLQMASKGYVNEVMCTSHLLYLHRMRLQKVCFYGKGGANGMKECSGSPVLGMRG